MDSELLHIVDDFDQKQKSGTGTPLTDRHTHTHAAAEHRCCRVGGEVGVGGTK